MKFERLFSALAGFLLAISARDRATAAKPPGPVDALHYDVSMSVDFDICTVRNV
jgi:hypothetical protein